MITKDNLLELISQREAYVVDHSSAWKRICKEHPDKAFVINANLSREDLHTKQLILNEERNKAGNVFSVGMHPHGFVLVDKLDEHFNHVFDMDKLEAISKNNGQTANEKETHTLRNEQMKETLRTITKNFFGLEFPKSGKASDLPFPSQMQSAITAIEHKINEHLPKCKHHFDNAYIVSTLCYLKLLLIDKVIRNEFDDPKKDNVFGDMDNLSTAVYLKCRLLTGDKRLAKMARYADLKCFETVPK